MPTWLSSLLAVQLVGLPMTAVAEPPDSGCMAGECHQEIEQRAFLHHPVAKLRCSPCHIADRNGGEVPAYHQGSVSRPLAPARGSPLCEQCHAALPPPHGEDADSKGDRCLRCHDAHGGAEQTILHAPEQEVCLPCHEQELALPRRQRFFQESGKDLAPALPEVYRHGPLAQGRCSPCHQMHVENLRDLSIGDLPQGANVPYDRTLYTSCLGVCHETDGIEKARTTTATAFRNGDDNLHFRHVVRPRTGRSCLLCHAPHQAENRALIRAGMPYGREILTLVFEPTDLGGRCTSSCHIPAEYDREEAVPSAMRIAPPPTSTEEP